ncbi:hypothetical protein BpHYR1_006221 [Brachionus plicatilis]|uniref:Uncharacterized protein n=1 Tax=Brachionus plicatilis TaxID=10195 RepID=A0A3M7S8L5_BRAPC|nr:hypothetical protein BpHYR1_006221 [Brachionus plicatilis]
MRKQLTIDEHVEQKDDTGKFNIVRVYIDQIVHVLFEWQMVGLLVQNTFVDQMLFGHVWLFNLAFFDQKNCIEHSVETAATCGSRPVAQQANFGKYLRVKGLYGLVYVT